MALETVLLHDGTQTVAAANYSNGANLPGANTAGTTGGTTGSGQFLAVKLSTATARTSLLVAALGSPIYGILQNKPKLGEAADVGLWGITKAVAGSAGVTFGLPQMTAADGRITDWVAGAASCQIGWALETAASGAIFTLFVTGANAKVLT